MIPLSQRLPASFCVSVLLSLLTNPTGATPGTLATDQSQIDSLYAFTRLYGYVRYFHPSDEAAQIDWDRFAVYGAERVLSIKTQSELKQVLEELFLPVAPLMRLCPDSPPGPCPAPSFTKEQAAGNVLAWQHLGVQGTGALYKSARTGRKRRAGPGEGFGGVTQSIAADHLRGRTIRIRAAVRAEVQGPSNAALLWARVDRSSPEPDWLHDSNRPIGDPQWKEYEISGPVLQDAIRLSFGCYLAGVGEAVVDAWRVEAQKEDGSWEQLKIPNPDFEENADNLEGWSTDSSGGYGFSTLEVGAYSGKRSACIRSAVPQTSGDLFAKKPGLGEMVDKPLTKGLRLMLPIALPDPCPSAGDGSGLTELMSKLAAIDVNASSASSPSIRLGAVVIAWNVFQHFYPYFDVVKADWPAELRRALAKALKDTGPEDFYVTLATLGAALQDGHFNVFAYDLPRYRLRTAFDCVEGVVVVTASQDPQVKSGDIVLEVNGRQVMSYLEGLERLISGSPQWKRWKALSWDFGLGPPGSKIVLKLKRGTQEIEVSVSPTLAETIFQPEPAGPAIDRLSEDVFYVDMRRAKMAEIRPRLEELASARGVIFDMRGYPTENYEVLSHLTDTPVQSAIWQIPQYIYPDREKLAGYDTPGRWLLEPMKPRIKRAVFLTSACAISYAESILGIVEHYRLGKIVGERTAGANGVVNSMQLPGRFGMCWTGMRVIKHDRSQHHLVGIQPSVPVRRSLSAVEEGRDEVLAKAVELLRVGRKRTR